MASSLTIAGIHAAYGAVRVIEDVSLNIGGGETVVLLGTNGNGKSTLMKCIMGMVRPSEGSIIAEIDGINHDLVGRSTEEIVDLGIALVPEGRRLFPKLRSRRICCSARSAARRAASSPAISRYASRRFPDWPSAARQLAGSMSGGEQQMLALGRALMLAPKILLVDEPSVGLAPILVGRTIEAIAEMKERYHLTVLMAEQNFTQAIRIANRGYVIVHGKIAFEGGSAETLNNNDLIRKFYLGL